MYARQVLGQPLGQRGDQHALALRGPLLDLLEQVRHLAPRRLDVDHRIDQPGRADDLLDDLALRHRQLVVGRRGRDEEPPWNFLLPLVEPQRPVVQARWAAGSRARPG